ncbi:signal peptidase II [Skermanella rosea]|uniref:Lipoprotein signal peptidase n=1 Tax=Skermanella cutis TaxID=2775420 RepID=A0ABX7B5R6_9PROT|nr:MULTISPECIES: signal peptidase II [Skermanella]QQP89502.1 signal peptidase II [Skermanella sp. TT6]UEM03646.1 signal peptidase II [Skermanella rosea]
MTNSENAASRRTGLWLALAIALLAAAADQASKRVILEHVMDPPRLIEVTPFFNLTLGFNRGVSFGMLSSDEALGPWLLVGLTLGIVAALIVWARRVGSRIEAAAIGGVIGGAIGNVIDRVRQGAVTDFLDFHALGWHWPAFNLADAAIFCGVAALLLHSWAADRAADKKVNAQPLCTRIENDKSEA